MSVAGGVKAIERRVGAAQGRIPCDGIIRDVSYLDVFTCEWRHGDIAFVDGTVVGVESGLKANREWNGKGKFLAPGFLDAHVHIESSMLLPHDFEEAVLSRGTTTAVCDPHELANVLGVKGIQHFLTASETMALDLRVMLSSCVPATDMETNGGGHLQAQDLVPLLAHPQALGLAEVMNMPGVLHADPSVLEKIASFAGRPIDGHSPLLRGNALSAYLAAGISSCHECTELDEAREKVSKGMSVWIREGSVAKDLDTLIPLLSMATSPSLGFCTDDRNPLDIAEEGHIDFLIRKAIKAGIAPEIVYRSASLSVARHYGLRQLGAIAPGYRADLVLLDDVRSCAVAQVWKSGRLVSEIEKAKVVKTAFENTIRAAIPDAVAAFEGPTGNVHVIGVIPGKIITSRSVEKFDAAGVARLSVLERYGHRSKPANGYVRGFGEHFSGAIAASVGHDSHNLIIVGKNTADMQTAARHLANVGGGFVVVKDGKVTASLDLPFGGLMSTQGLKHVETRLKDLRAASRAIQCDLAEPFLQLAFLSLPVIPSLKLTDKGLVDVDQFKIISVAA